MKAAVLRAFGQKLSIQDLPDPQARPRSIMRRRTPARFA
jgi:hypothetical protein